MSAQGPMAGVTPADTQEKQPLWSIERVVAFVLAPLMTAGAGWLSLTIATSFPGHPYFPPEAIFGFAIVMTGAVATFFHKWLAERSKQLMYRVPASVLGPVLGTAHTLDANPAVHDFIHTTLADLEGLAQSAARHVAENIQTPPPIPIPPAASDPAPATAVAADPGVAATV